MCGICGRLNFDHERPVDERLIRDMAAIMYHRGPDDSGMYIKGPVGLGHRRLSIIDLNTGKQPISNEDGTVWIVFNGEIYNYQEIRRVLTSLGHRFTTKTDTEVILHAYEEYGADCVTHLRGMFAFAIWDENTQTLFLARDRVGIKPLYYYQSADSLIFASEIKSILQDQSVPRVLDPRMIDRFLTYLYLPGVETPIKGLKKLAPGHQLICRNGTVDVRQYWDLDFAPVSAGRKFESCKADLIDLLKESVRLHMISDVPVGFLLSGGVDSTGLLSLSVGETDKELSSFTIGFDGHKFADERPYARLAAQRFGTKHYEMTISARDFADFLPAYVWHMEEPVCEPPAVALYYVSKLASEHVKVLISGEGGDEAFGGYQTYRNFLALERLKRALGPARHSAKSLLTVLSGNRSNGRFRKYVHLLQPALREYYLSRTSTPFTEFNPIRKDLYTPDFASRLDEAFTKEPTAKLFADAARFDDLSKMLYVDSKTWLPDDLLIKADKITMANSVELRVPLLDHKVLEFAAGLPSNFKVNGTETKHILKQALNGRIPSEIVKRKKTGFPVPYDFWLKGELKSMAQDVLLDTRTLDRGYFNKGMIEGILAGAIPADAHGKIVFSLLTLELWHRLFADRKPWQT